MNVNKSIYLMTNLSIEPLPIGKESYDKNSTWLRNNRSIPSRADRLSSNEQCLFYTPVTWRNNMTTKRENFSPVGYIYLLDLWRWVYWIFRNLCFISVLGNGWLPLHVHSMKSKTDIVKRSTIKIHSLWKSIIWKPIALYSKCKLAPSVYK